MTQNLQNFFYEVYQNLSEDLRAKTRRVGEIAQTCYGAASGSAQWIYEALQGDWNDERTPAQIAADSVLSMVPIIDQIFDIRDICANCRKLREDASNGETWLSLCLCLIGLIPTLGSLVKGVLKIIFVYIKRLGSRSVVAAVDAALEAIGLFLKNEKVVKLISSYDLAKSYMFVADKTREVIGKLNARYLALLFNDLIENFGSLIRLLERRLPKDFIDVLRNKHADLVVIQSQIGSHLDNCLGPVKNILGEIAARLEGHAAKAERRATASGGKVPAAASGPSGKTARANSQNPDVEGNSTLRWEDMPGKTKNAQKGLFGEIVSDNHMIAEKHTPLLPVNRQAVDNLDTKTRDAYFIDGVYKNANPPKTYIITEAKFRASGKFSAGELPATKGSTHNKVDYPSAKQMSDPWIEKRLENDPALTKKQISKISGNYERWVLVVDESGKVIKKIELDAAGNAIKP